MNDTLVIILFLILPNVMVFGLVYALQTFLIQRGMKALLCVGLAILVSFAFIVIYLTVLGDLKTMDALFLDLDATGIASVSFVGLLIWIVVAPTASLFAYFKFKRRG